jgi:hypothetical protein
MMFLLLIVLSEFIIGNYSFKNKNLNTFLSNNFSNHFIKRNRKLNDKLNNKSNDGYDHRFPLETNKSEEENKLYNIFQIFKKKEILDLLTNENVSIYTKIGILRENVIYSSNIYEGGLMKDFDFPPF